MTRPILSDAFGHHHWATIRLIDACLPLTQDQLATVVPGTFGTILDTMRHIVGADAGYLFVLTDGAVTEVEEAAMSLGASRAQTFWRVILPSILPALLTGFALALARAVGEYGSVIFIAGNMPMVSEIAPLLIVIKLEQFDYAGAAAIGVVMLGISFLLLLAINLLQNWSRRYHRI